MKRNGVDRFFLPLYVAAAHQPSAQLEPTLHFKTMQQAFSEIGTIPYHPDVKHDFQNNELWKDWYERYPELFDERDLSNVQSQAEWGSHFCEWLAAIFLFQMTGWLSLQQKYQFKKHVRKQEVLERLGASNLMCFFDSQKDEGWGSLQAPDLLVFPPDYSDWFFCEVKGPNDRLRPKQKEYFRALVASIDRPIRVLHLSRWPGEMV